jgi:phage terminase large subunit-like protein
MDQHLISDEDLDWFDRWGTQAHPHQTPPEGDWMTWLLLGGRGSGKTRAGAEWVQEMAEPGVRIALIGPSLHDVREVMIDGPSGLKAIAAHDGRPEYEISRRRLIWPNGAMAYAFSAEDPESLRGPQFHYAWADEFCVWRKPAETLALLRMGLRLGQQPRLCVTTTPKPVAALRKLMAEPGLEIRRAATKENAQFLSDSFLSGLETLYGGTRLAAQELDGQVVEASDRALWRAADFEACRGNAPATFDEVIVAVDPPVTQNGDACGLIVAGRRGDRAYVLKDASVSGRSPTGWATQAAALVREHAVRRVVAEVNQGGDMVETVLKSAGVEVPVHKVRARVGKRLRAEPVAALYEQGRVVHVGQFPLLEEELMGLGDGSLDHSPDRADALVWAITALLIDGRAEPRLRRM